MPLGAETLEPPGNSHVIDTIVDTTHKISGGITLLGSGALVAAVFPVTNIAFGVLSYVVQQALGDNISLMDAYENGLDITGTICIVSAVTMIATHPVVYEGEKIALRGMQCLSSSAYHFFSKSSPLDDASSEPDTALDLNK